MPFPPIRSSLLFSMRMFEESQTAIPTELQFLNVLFLMVTFDELVIIRHLPPGLVKHQLSITTPFWPLMVYSPEKVFVHVPGNGGGEGAALLKPELPLEPPLELEPELELPPELPPPMIEP